MDDAFAPIPGWSQQCGDRMGSPHRFDWVRFGFTLLFAGEKLCGKRISRYGALAYLWAKRRDDQKEAESLDRYFEISTLQNTAPIETCHFISGPLPCREVLGWWLFAGRVFDLLS